MFLFTAVDNAFTYLVEMVHTNKLGLLIEQDSRNGPVKRFTAPVIAAYIHPRNRVLLNRARDCNPFFHVYEALWMLAGRNDVDSVSRFVKRMKEFSDNGRTFHGAYGYRWREYFGYNQLEWIIEELRDHPDSRRCVLQMWDGGRTYPEPFGELAEVEAVEGTGDLYAATHGGKDVPCNTNAYFSIVQGKLDMTVCNRSNDMIWGMLGANVVHFSFLQEYIANHIGIPVGVYYQFTNNLHVYLNEHWKPEEFLKEECDNHSYPVNNIPLVNHIPSFEEELQRFVDNPFDVTCTFRNKFLSEVARPMMRVWYHHDIRNYVAAETWIEKISPEAPDWKLAVYNWITKRSNNYYAKNQGKKSKD